MPFMQSLCGSLAWHWWLDEQLLPSELHVAAETEMDLLLLVLGGGLVVSGGCGVALGAKVDVPAGWLPVVLSGSSF